MIIKELTIQRDAFSVLGTRPAPNRLSIALEGSADMRVQSEFATMIYKIHDEARRNHVSMVTVNMQKLEFLSSGCFKGLCTWVRLLLERGTPYKLCIVSNPSYHWQSRSLQALRLLAPEHVTIEKP
ncbi:MAG: hypothetical protein JNM83_27130 [Myxococcales bacterium]|jgi:hypothetical protein|nr:hypothetical protein [Myxococcales bacterium]